MTKKLLIIEVAALSQRLKLHNLEFHTTQSVFPSVTCTVQASFRTASRPEAHGMVANGIFFKPLRRPMFWEQSAGLVKGQRIWEKFRNNGKSVAILFWQQSLGEKVDIVLSPAPIHKHHGGMIQDCYCQPNDLYTKLCKDIGSSFKLHNYWGPMASWKAGEWIVKATSRILQYPELAPDLCLTYLPTLDYDLQRSNPLKSLSCSRASSKVTKQLSTLIKTAKSEGYHVLIFGDYHIVPVKEPVFPNLALRQSGLMNTRNVKGMLYPDFYTSRAFAVVDHEIAHVYISNQDDIPVVQDLFGALDGVGKVYNHKDQVKTGINHENSGELLIVADEGAWFAYPWWNKKSEAPDYASHVDIHNKPGYDPCELFFGWPPGSVCQNSFRIRGSHGRIGHGREVVWASDVSFHENPSNLIELASMVRDWLEESL